MDADPEEDTKERFQVMHESVLLTKQCPNCHESSCADLIWTARWVLVSFSNCKVEVDQK
jgi:hypothetical protein